MTQEKALPRTATCEQTQPPRSWNVVLLDDQDHTFDYVIRMVTTLFRRSMPEALEIAKRVHAQGRAVLLTTHKEHAELKRDQVHAFGRDEFVAECAGSMSALIEPALDDDEGDGGSA